jgi:hypothetical protein
MKFELSKGSAVIRGKIRGRDSVVYKLNARHGQVLQVRLIPN